MTQVKHWGHWNTNGNINVQLLESIVKNIKPKRSKFALSSTKPWISSVLRAQPLFWALSQSCHHDCHSLHERWIPHRRGHQQHLLLHCVDLHWQDSVGAPGEAPVRHHQLLVPEDTASAVAVSVVMSCHALLSPSLPLLLWWRRLDLWSNLPPSPGSRLLFSDCRHERSLRRRHRSAVPPGLCSSACGCCVAPEDIPVSKAAKSDRGPSWGSSPVFRERVPQLHLGWARHQVKIATVVQSGGAMVWEVPPHLPLTRRREVWNLALPRFQRGLCTTPRKTIVNYRVSSWGISSRSWLVVHRTHPTKGPSPGWMSTVPCAPQSAS